MQLIVTSKKYTHALNDIVKCVDNILLVIEDDLNAAFFAGLVINIEPSEERIFDRILGRF